MFRSVAVSIACKTKRKNKGNGEEIRPKDKKPLQQLRQCFLTPCFDPRFAFFPEISMP